MAGILVSVLDWLIANGVNAVFDCFLNQYFIFCVLCAWSDVLIFLTDRARDKFFNSTADAVSIKNGINATHSGQEFNLTFYLSIYSGKPSIPMLISTSLKYC